MATKKNVRVDHVLVVWEEVPETTKLVLIPRETLDDDDLRALRAAAGAFINNETTEEQDVALACINNALCDEPKYLAEEHPVGSKWAMRWKGYVHDTSTPIEGCSISLVVVCGFIL